MVIGMRPKEIRMRKIGRWCGWCGWQYCGVPGGSKAYATTKKATVINKLRQMRRKSRSEDEDCYGDNTISIKPYEIYFIRCS